MCPSCTRDTDGIAAKLLRCGIASEALRRNMPLSLREPQPSEAYILQKPPSKNPLFLAPEFPNELYIRYFRKPLRAPRPTSQNPPATKKEIPKIPKTPIIPKSRRLFSPKVDARSPKVDAHSPKVNARSLKVNVKYF